MGRRSAAGLGRRSDEDRRALRLLQSRSPVQAPNGLHGFLNKPDEECGEEGTQPFEESVIHAMNSRPTKTAA